MARNPWTITKEMFLSTQEVQSLMKALTDAKDLALQRRCNYVHVRDHGILTTLLLTGLRVSELVALKVGNLKSSALTIRCGKNGKARTVVLDDQARRLLRDYIRVKEILGEPTDEESSFFVSERRKPYTTRGVRKRVKVWFKHCGFSASLSCHSCRHTYISHLISVGVDLPTVSANAGHGGAHGGGLAVTALYSHSVRESLGDISLYKSSASKGKRNYYGSRGKKSE